MRLQPETHGSRARVAAATPGDNVLTALTIAASAAEFWVIDSVIFGYDDAPATGDRNLLLDFTQNGVAQNITVPLAAVLAPAGPQLLFPDQCLWGDKNTNFAFSLSASGTAGNLGYISVLYH